MGTQPNMDKMSNFLSIVTPTYNRAHLIRRSLDASLLLVRSGLACEIVVVDDASTDNTFELLQTVYADEIAQALIVIDRFAINQGVTAAKNRGAELARGHWVAFMDSDDNFIVENAAAMIALLEQHLDDAAVFFRCRDNQQKKLIGPDVPAAYIGLKDIINGGTPGECLPVINRQVILAHPYPAELRGSESLSYFSMLRASERIFISALIVREYEYSGDDRLSAKKGLRARAAKLVVHNIRTLRFFSALNTKTLIGVLLRIAYYSWLTCLNKFTR